MEGKTDPYSRSFKFLCSAEDLGAWGFVSKLNVARLEMVGASDDA